MRLLAFDLDDQEEVVRSLAVSVRVSAHNRPRSVPHLHVNEHEQIAAGDGDVGDLSSAEELQDVRAHEIKTHDTPRPNDSRAELLEEALVVTPRR